MSEQNTAVRPLNLRLQLDPDAQEAVLAEMMAFTRKYEKIIADSNQRIQQARSAGAPLSEFGMLADQENELIGRLAEEYDVQSSEYEALMESLADAAVERLQTEIATARSMIAQLMEDGIDEEEVEKYLRYIALIDDLQTKLTRAQAAPTEPEKKRGEQWKKDYEALKKFPAALTEIGTAMGGVIGEALKTSGIILDSTLTIINAITTLANGSATATAASASTASKAIQKVEKASAVLTAISAIIKAVTTITGLFKDNKQALEDAEKATRDYEKALEKIGISKRYDLFDTLFGIDAIGKFKAAKDISIETLDDIQKHVNDIQNRSITFLRMTIADPIEATYDGRSKWNKLIGSGDHKIKNTYFQVSDYFGPDGSIDKYGLEALQKWYDSHKDALDDAEKKTLEELIKDSTVYVEAMKTMTDTIDQLWGDLASSIAGNMLDAFLETGDAASNLGKLVDDVAKNMAKSMIESLLVENIFNDDLQTKLLDLLKEGDQTGANELVQNAIASTEELAPRIEGIITSLGLASAAAAEAAPRSAAAKGFAQASQESIDSLSGLFTNIEGNVFGIREILRTSQEIQQVNTDAALGHLSAIHLNTNRLETIENHLFGMRGSMEDMADSMNAFTRG